MKKLLTLAFTIVFIVSCGYKDKNECMLKEQQKCDGGCYAEAEQYCAIKHPSSREQAKSKELRKEYGSYEECFNLELDGSSSVYAHAQIRTQCRSAFPE